MNDELAVLRPVGGSAPPPELVWIVLTMGDRPVELGAAVNSLVSSGERVLVVGNGSETSPAELRSRDRHDGDVPVGLLVLPDNVGVPGGRDLGLEATTAPIVGFLDDDAVVRSSITAIVDAFQSEPHLGAVSFRIVDETGASASRHVPRPGGRKADESGAVATFLGGASAIRREAYDQVGGYFTDLFYGHEEVELSWRLIDAGWSIRYLADVQVFHPRAEIGRHHEGWRLTGRNRVWIARRTLPWPVAAVHVVLWLAMGLVRAPGRSCRFSYVSGWWEGWRTTWPGRSRRQPISWRGVWHLTRLGRPPVF